MIQFKASREAAEISGALIDKTMRLTKSLTDLQNRISRTGRWTSGSVPAYPRIAARAVNTKGRSSLSTRTRYQ
jgi:hypothetical protein